VILSMKDAVAYTDFRADVLVLEQLKRTYDQAMGATINGGPAQTFDKNTKKGKVVTQMDKLSDKLEATPGVDESFILNAGFPRRLARSGTYGKPPIPQVLERGPTNVKGEVSVLLQDPKPAAVITHIIEYSIDGGVTWLPLGHNTHLRFILTGLP